MEKGLYLYCVRRKSPASVKAVKTTLNVAKTTLDVVKTIDKGEVYTIPYKGLEAVVSEVSLKKFGSEEVQRRAREDLSWIKEKAQIHEHVIEQAMRLGGKIIPIIPMRFGTIFKTEKSLKKTLKRTYPQFIKMLGKLRGKQEWGVKVYLNEEVFEKQFKTPRMVTRGGSSEVKKLASVPKGMDYFVKKQMEEVTKKEKNRKLQEVLKEIFENLQKLAVKTSQGKNLDKALTGREEPMVLNLNLLIKEEKVKEFQKEVNRLKTKYQGLGFLIQESGPWPPFNFVQTKLLAKRS